MARVTKKKLILLGILLFLAGGACFFLGSFLWLRGEDRTLVRRSDWTRLQKLDQRYGKLDQIQKEIQEKSLKIPSLDQRMNGIYKGLAASVGDPYTQYLTPREKKAWDAALKGSHTGVGLYLALDRKGRVMVQDVLPSSPAQAAGLRAGDLILKVDGHPVSGEEAAAQRLAGKKGSRVTVTYERDGKARTAAMVRASIEERSVYSRSLKGGITYIRILAFTKDTADRFQTELSAAEGGNAKGVIIDLRGNGGGYASSAVEVADQLLPEGTITYTVDGKGKRTNYNSDERCAKVPFVLLVNGQTASASELLAAAVQDAKAGKLIGQKTYGKGAVQEEKVFSDGSALRLTTKAFYSPRGRKIDGTGVTPDLTVARAAGGKDPALSRAAALLGGK